MCLRGEGDGKCPKPRYGLAERDGEPGIVDLRGLLRSARRAPAPRASSFAASQILRHPSQGLTGRDPLHLLQQDARRVGGSGNRMLLGYVAADVLQTDSGCVSGIFLGQLSHRER